MNVHYADVNVRTNGVSSLCRPVRSRIGGAFTAKKSQPMVADNRGTSPIVGLGQAQELLSGQNRKSAAGLSYRLLVPGAKIPSVISVPNDYDCQSGRSTFHFMWFPNDSEALETKAAGMGEVDGETAAAVPEAVETPGCSLSDSALVLVLTPQRAPVGKRQSWTKFGYVRLWLQGSSGQAPGTGKLIHVEMMYLYLS